MNKIVDLMNHLPNILIVDDIEENLVLLEVVMEKIKINLIRANSGIEALEKTQGVDLALAIIDVKMPIMNGFKLAKKLNECRPDSEVPIIFITANYVTDATEGYESGAVDYIQKPFNSKILLSKIIVFLNLFNQKQIIGRNAELLKESSDELKKSLEQLHHLAKYTEKSREYERKSIARELHDDLGQALTAVKIDLGIIKRNVKEENVLFKIDKLSTLVSNTIKTVQRITSELRPGIIDDLGLNAAIEWYTKEFGTRNEIDIFLDVESEIPISSDDSITLFRIMQESLTNIARHARANRVEIGLFCLENTINFKISDNGIGITDANLSSKKSYGLIGMRERAITLDGTLEIYSESGNGTVVSLNFPIQLVVTNRINE